MLIDCTKFGLSLYQTAWNQLYQGVADYWLMSGEQYPLLYEAVFVLKETGFKLDVTRWVPRLTQSVYSDSNERA